MSKKQVLLLSFFVAGPALGLLAALVMGGTMYGHGGNMFSGAMTVFVALTGILALVLGLSPFAIMAFYPADGFAMAGGVPEAGAAPSAPPRPQTTDGDDFEDDDDGFEADSADDDGFDDFDDDGEEMYDDGDEAYDDEEWN
ncbi:MAG: hypothetical protein R3C59_29315 [Planctomycetaceae bacterium]